MALRIAPDISDGKMGMTQSSTAKSHFRDQAQRVLWPDSRSPLVIVFGMVGSTKLLVNISSFLHAIDWLKAREKGRQ